MMAGLSNFISNTGVQTTTLPTWYDQAQQNLVNQGQSAYGAAPQLGQTVAQGAINTLSGPSNPFTQATGTLGQIATGAANPWITDQATGQVTPDTSTAMGGLFQAQNQQLNQLMPNLTAAPGASAIGSGNFGSLRGQTAVDKAKGDAFASLMTQQMQSALQNQQTGVQAGIGQGSVAQEGITNQMNVGAAQQTAPFTNVANLGKIISGVNAPTTVSNQVQLSPLSQIASVASALGGGATTANSILSKLGLSGALGSAGDWLSSFLAGPNAADAQNQTGGFYGGTAPANPYAGMNDAQIQYAIDQGFGSNPTSDQIAQIQADVPQ